MKRVFVYSRERAIGILDKEFSWMPGNIIDTAEVAKKEKIVDVRGHSKIYVG